MKNASQILSAKGYDNDDQITILYYKTKYSEDGLDMKVRTEFKVQDEPLHLWEAYYIGDANEENLEKIAKEQGFESVGGMLIMMDARLLELCEEIEEKM